MKTALETWHAICNEAEGIVVAGQKYLLLDEEMTFRMGEVLEREHANSIETKAREIYDRWKDQPGWKPWVEGGNSFRQDDARSIAATNAAIAKTNGGGAIPCGRPSKRLCHGGPECWCKQRESS